MILSENRHEVVSRVETLESTAQRRNQERVRIEEGAGESHRASAPRQLRRRL
jgi:hypothetical protein